MSKEKKSEKKDEQSDEMKSQELFMQFNMFQQKSKQIEEQIQTIERQISEFNVLKKSVKDFSENKEEEFIAPLGNGIFVSAKPTQDKRFYVGIGSDILVKRDQKQSEEIISKQIKKLEEIRKGLFDELDKISRDIQNLIESAEKK
jgi:prefoldin alpha subunit